MERYQFGKFTPLCVQSLGHRDVPPAGHAIWAEVGGSITFVTSGEIDKTVRYLFEGGSNSINGKPYMLALAGQPSLHGCNARVVYWRKRGTPEKLQAKAW